MQFDRRFLIGLGLFMVAASLFVSLVAHRDGMAIALLGAGVAFVAFGTLLPRITSLKMPGGFEAELRELKQEQEELKSKTEELSEDVGAMNLFWDNLRANAEIQIRASGTSGVRLEGGPMDGWLVKLDAPALQPDWYKTWPSSVRKRHRPGRYGLSGNKTWAEWKDF